MDQKNIHAFQDQMGLLTVLFTSFLVMYIKFFFISSRKTILYLWNLSYWFSLNNFGMEVATNVDSIREDKTNKNFIKGAQWIREMAVKVLIIIAIDCFRGGHRPVS